MEKKKKIIIYIYGVGWCVLEVGVRREKKMKKSEEEEEWGPRRVWVFRVECAMREEKKMESRSWEEEEKWRSKRKNGERRKNRGVDHVGIREGKKMEQKKLGLVCGSRL